jgi:hypothetical protein
MKPTQIIVITGDFKKGQTICQLLNEHRYANTLITGFSNFSKGRLFGFDDQEELRAFHIERFGLAFVDQITSEGFVPKWRSGARIISKLHLVMPCVAIGSTPTSNDKLINAGAIHWLSGDNVLPFIETTLPTIAVRARRRKPVVKSLTGS